MKFSQKMPLYFFYTMVQKSQKWPKTQIKGGSCLKWHHGANDDLSQNPPPPPPPPPATRSWLVRCMWLQSRKVVCGFFVVLFNRSWRRRIFLQENCCSLSWCAFSSWSQFCCQMHQLNVWRYIIIVKPRKLVPFIFSWNLLSAAMPGKHIPSKI